jgi:hypothetical protein
MDQDQKRREFAERMRQHPQPSLAEQHGDCPPQTDEEADKRNRQGKAVEMLTVILKNGDAHAFSYGFLHPLDFIGGEIVAHFMTHAVTLRGRNLRTLFDCMRRKVQEMIYVRDELHAEARGEEWCVTDVDIAAHNREASAD